MNTSDLIASCQDDWDEYTRHRFVRELGKGTLPEAAFRNYLEQDYLFLIHFARAYALAIYKSHNLADMAKPFAALQGLIEHETRLHVAYCEKWGMTEEQMMVIPEQTATVAYTRLVLDTGQSESLTTLYAALAPCTIGYGVIGQWLVSHPATVLEGNPYREWIETYNDEVYQQSAVESREQLDGLLSEVRLESTDGKRIVKVFGDAVRMEIGFFHGG